MFKLGKNESAELPPPEQRKQEPQTDHKGNRRRDVIILILIILLLLVAGCFVVRFVFLGGNNEPAPMNIPEANGEVFDGALPTDDPQAILDELQRKVDENQFAFRINSHVVFPADCKNGNIRVENPSRNHYDMTVQLVLDDTGEVLYTSPVIHPDQYIEKIDLAQTLKPGEYSATAYFIASHPDTGDYMGEVAAEVKITVEKGK